MPVPFTMSNNRGSTEDPLKIQPQEKVRSWTTSSYSTKKIISDGNSGGCHGELFIPSVNQTTTNKSLSSDLFSNHHRYTTKSPDTCSSNGVTNSSSTKQVTSSSIKSSGLISKALQEMEDDFMEQRPSSSTAVIPMSTSLTLGDSGGWLGDSQQVPLSYEVVTKPDGKKEFQLKLDAKHFNPEDLQVKVEQNTLIICGTHEEKSASGTTFKSISRRCTIPPGVKPGDLNCSLDTSGRLMLTAPVTESNIATGSVTTTRTITHHSQPVVQTGYKIGPGTKEQVVTIFQHGEGGPRGDNGVTTKTISSRIVRTFKNLS